MGIHQTKSLLKTYYSKPHPKDADGYLNKVFCPESLQLNEFLEDFWDTNASEYFDWTNIQENKKPEDIAKEKDSLYSREKYILTELPLNPTITESVFSTDTLAECREAYNPSDTKYFSNTFIKRMNIILIAYVKKILSTFNENSTLDCIAKYFESLSKDEDKVGKANLELGMNLFIRLLDDISGKTPKLKEETLNFLVSNSIFLRPLAFWGETKNHFILDKSLNDISNYLKKIIADKSETPVNKYKAFKVLLNFGFAKGSLRNLLDFVDNFKYIEDFVDLNYEINLFKNEFIKLSLSVPSTENVKVNSKLWGFKYQPKKKEGEEIKSDSTFSITNDSSYTYIFSSQGYLAKIGTGYNNTMLGKIYQFKENYRVGERGTIALVEGVLFYRSPNLDPNPVICLSTDTFEEIPLTYELNTKEVNHLWVEGKKQEFEFPHSSYKDMNEIIEKKKNLGAEDKSNNRPCTASPMVSDGRFVYIFSKWYDDIEVLDDKAADDDDDEPKQPTKKQFMSIYGVDIYDPMSNMIHMRSVKFNIKKENNEEEIPDLLKANTILFTNGNIFVVDKYKLNLTDGESEKITDSYVDNIKTACYDLHNNNIWGIKYRIDGSAEKIDLVGFFNHSAKPIVEFPETNEKYMPCSLEKIIQHAEGLIKLENLSNKVSMKTYLRENTLNILGLEDQTSIDFKKQNLVVEKDDKTNLGLYKKCIQCLILSTIAKLSEYFGQVQDVRSANTDEERGKILSQACRRPYCVKLEPETFEILINFVNEFSEAFFKNKGDEKLRQLDNYCLLSTIKILRTNLNCLSVSNLDIDFFIKDKNNNPFIKVKEFIFKIFEIYHNTTVRTEDKEIVRALYEECKIILSVSINIIYPNNYEIIEILEHEITKFKESKYSKDVVKCILEWMSNEDNMKNLLLKLKKEGTDRIFNIFKIVSNWEVQHFKSFIADIQSVQTIPKYSANSHDEITAFKFSSNMQIEILKIISKKLLNDNYEDIENEQILHSFSTIIFDNIHEIFRTLRLFLEDLPNIIERDWKLISKSDEPVEETIDTTVPVQSPDKPVVDAKHKSLADYKADRNKEIWNQLIEKVITSDLLIIKTFTFHIDTLSILTSNFILSSMMLNSYHSIIDEMNKIYYLLKECEKQEEKTETSDYKELIFESEHPYPASVTKWFTLEIPGEKEIFIEFDPQCYTKQNCAYVNLYTDTTMSTYAFPQYTTLNVNYPKETLKWSNGPLHLYFYSDNCTNSSNYWGFKVKIHNGKNNSYIKLDDKFTSMMRSVCWVSCKCSAQLLRGNFTKSLTSVNEEDDLKYNSILNSKLFAGGVDFEDITKENDPLLTNIINIFDAIIPEHKYTKAPKSAERKLLTNILNGDNLNINKVLAIFQKKFSKEVIWSGIGGEQADSLVRAAFSALLRHSDHTTDFERLLDRLEFNEENQECTKESNDEAIIKSIEADHGFNIIYRKWVAASRMRTWLVEKKKNIDEMLEKNKTKKEESDETEQDTASDDITKKIIEQTIIKAKFLIKLNPSPAFSQYEGHQATEKKTLLVRSSSLELDNQQDDWKRRLHQWKAVQKSKKVIKSVEDEANENLTSLTSAVLMCLQSSISSKRLWNKIKIATIRAKGREIGLLTIRNILEKISHPNLIQDLLSWFSSSLRKFDNKICHYLDNVIGCGKHFEERVKHSFQEFITLLITKLIKSEKPNELKSFVDALVWKYSASDHKFLVDHSVFLILWGTYNEAIKNSWGKPIKHTLDAPEDKKTKIEENCQFTNELLEVFEVLSNICLDRAIIARNLDKKQVNPIAEAKKAINIKFPALEKKTSIVDDTNSESLVRHILDVIFGEVIKAITSYLRYRGISYNLWKQYEKYEEEKADEKKKKPAEANNNANEAVEDAEPDEGAGSPEEAEEEESAEEAKEEEVKEETKEDGKDADKDKEKKDDNVESPEKPYYYEAIDLINLYDELRGNNNKPNGNKRTYISPNELMNIINQQSSEIYDPEFLNRLLTILYKCSIQNHSDKIVFAMANPLNFSSMIKLIRLCSTQNKILIVKILQNICSHVPEEILIESIDMILSQPEGDKLVEGFAEKRKLFNDYDKMIFVEYIITLIKDIKGKVWEKDSESYGCYIVSSELIVLLRKLWYSDIWNDCITSLLSEVIDEKNTDYLKKEIILSIFGSDYRGQANGAIIKVKTDADSKGLNFDFIKKDYNEHYNYGTIVGFSPNMDELWNKKQSKENKKKAKKVTSVSLTPNNNTENQIAVLLHGSILGEDFNLNDLTPKIYGQHEIMVTQNKVDYSHLKISNENIAPLLDYVLNNKDQSSEALNLKTEIIRFINNYIASEKGIEQFLSLDQKLLTDSINSLISVANQQIQYKNNYLNLDILEEKRYRLLCFCSENGYSLKEIPKMSLTFKKPNYLVIRCSSNNLVNLVFNISGVVNYDNLCKLTDYEEFTLDTADKEYVVCSPENIEKYLGKQFTIITHSVDTKPYDQKIKKTDPTSLVVIDQSSFNEIESLYKSTMSTTPLEDTVSFKSILQPKNEKLSMVNELEEFGFSRELIEAEISKSKEDLDLNSLIANLLEYKEKNKDIEEKPEEEKKEELEKAKELQQIEEADVENKNDCFTTSDNDGKVIIPDYMDDLFLGENEDYSLLYKNFKSINEKIHILYARRMLLSVFSRLLDESQNTKNEAIIDRIPIDQIINVLKLLTHEGLFLNSINWGSELLLQIKKVLIKIYSSDHIKKCKELSDNLTKTTLSELESVLKSKNTAYEFITKNEEVIINKPMIFFNIWILMIMNENSKTKSEYSFIFNILAGLVTKITDNKQIRWFILDLLIQLVYKISNKLKEDPEFINVISLEKSLKDVENVNKLRTYLDDSINRESKKNLSKRSQMICEFLIYLEEISNKINQLSGKTDQDNLSIILQSDYKKDNFIADLLTTFELMKEFFDKKYLKYLSWVEINPDIINTSKLTFESSHLYPKAPHTFLINVPNTTTLEFNISNDTLLDNGDAIVFSLDKNSTFPIECYANRSSKKTFTIQSSHTFVHFPSNYLTEVYSFGSNTYTRLGQSGTDIFTPKLIESLSSVLVKDIAIGDTFVTVLTHTGDLLSCGNGNAAGLKTTSNVFTKATGINNPDKINSEGINIIGVNNGSTVVGTKDYSLYSIGVNAYGQLGQAWTSPVNEITAMNFQKKIKQISISETHSMLTTFDGKVYHLGNNDYYQNGENNTSRNNTPKLIVIPKNFFVEMCTCGEYYSIFLTKDIVTGKRKLYASGWSKQGRTGTGKDDESNAFKAIAAPEIENVEFRFIASAKLSSAAISTTNKLYTWGNNPKGQCGLGHYNDVFEPTLVTFFDKYDIEDVSMSLEHTLVIAKDVEKNKISVFAFGDSTNGKLGETVTQKAEKKDTVPTPIKISFFEGKNPTRVITGPRASVVICKLNSYESLRDIHQISCSKCEKQIIGNLYADLSKEHLKVYCKDCNIDNHTAQLVLKAPLKSYKIITDIFKKYEKVLDTDNHDTSSNTTQCKHCKETITFSDNNVGYLFLEGKTRCALCKSCLDIYPSSVTSVKVYLKSPVLLKNIDITQVTEYYESSISYGHKFSITPVLNEKGCESVIEKHQNSFNSYVEDINESGKPEVYEHFVDLLNSMAQKAEKSIFTYIPKDLSFKKEELSVRPALEKCNNDFLRKLFVILKILNNKVKELLPFIDFSKVLQDNQRLSHHFNKITPLIFWDTKNELIKYYLEKTVTEFEVGELKVNRLKVRKFIEKGKPDHTGEYSLFGLIFQFLKNKPFKIFRKKDTNRESKLFNVTFVGEASIDAGGPYREAITQAFTELQSPTLPLLIPSPNQKNESGLFREKWVINPSSKSTIHLEMYKVLGGLIGYAIRTGEFLSLDLPSIFWKQLLEVPIDRKDLECIDRYTVQCLDDIINIHKKGVTADNFTFYVDQKFTTCLSDGSEVEIIKDGKDIELTYNDRIKYCELVEKVRLEESKIQIAAIRSGLE
jgi:alpha-tubulin suppressor-like RCC1 family protein